MAAETAVAVTAPCAIDGMPEAVYHADPVQAGSLSSTEAKLVLDCPAVLRWRRAHPQEPTDTFDFGHVVHRLVLGAGQEIAVIPDEILSSSGAATTKEAKDFKAQARADGRVPIKRAGYDQAATCARAVTEDPAISAIFKDGRPEVSVFAPDPDTGVWMRGRIDWVTSGGVLVDVKTAPSANPADFTRQAASYDYALQREWYRAIWEHLTGQAATFLHVVVSKVEPYLASVVEMDVDFAAVGASKMRRALDRYAACQASGNWPGYPPVIHTIGPPAYYIHAEEDQQ